MRIRRFSSVFVLSLAAIGTAVTLAGQDVKADLRDPSTIVGDAPAKYQALFETSKGSFTIEVDKSWAPRGAIRFYNLVKNGYYNDARVFRVLPGFMAQFGIKGIPDIDVAWRGARIVDDVRQQTNERGYVSFAAGGANTRTTQVFVNLKDNKPLDDRNFAPFGRVVNGMNNIEKLYDGYGDGAPNGSGPDQNKVYAEGNAYLLKSFPKLDYIKTATIVDGK